MFSRLTSLVSQAVDVVTSSQPQKLPVDHFLQHWAYVKGIYDEQRRVLPRSVYETNVPYHLQQMINFIQKEEIGEDSLTGPCLEALLQNRMLEVMVGWAEMDTPPGMRPVVLKTYTQLLSSLHHRLLPEGAIRTPLQRLIHFCHQLDMDGTVGDADHGDEMRLSLISLMNVVALQIRQNPALLNLFLREVRDKTTPNNSPSKFNPQTAQWTFPLLMQLYDYITAPQDEVSLLARQAFLVCVDLLCRDLPNLQVPQAKMGVILAQRLIILFSMLPNIWPPETTPLSSSPAVRKSMTELIASPPDSVQYDNDEKAIESFLDFWMFVLEVLARLEEGSKHRKRLQENEDGENSRQVEYLDNQVMRVLSGSFLSGFLNDQISPKDEVIEFLKQKLSEMPESGSDLGEQLEEWLTKLNYVTMLMNVVAEQENSSTSKWTEHVFVFLFSSTCIGPLLMQLIVHPIEIVSVAVWKLLDSLLATYHPSVYRHLILQHLDKKNADRPLYTFSATEFLIEEILAMAATMDPLWSNQSKARSRDNFADEKILLDSEAAERYDAYFIEAQDRHPQIVRRYVPWGHVSLSPTVISPVPPATILPDDLASLNLIQLLEDSWDKYWALSPRQLLQLTRFIARLAHLPDPLVHRWLFESSQDSPNGWFPKLKKTYNEAIEKWNSMPDIQERWHSMQNLAKDDVVVLFQEWNTALRSSAPKSEVSETENTELKREESQDSAPLSLFVPAYLILAECLKEIAAIAVVVERTMQIMDANVLTPQ